MVIEIHYDFSALQVRGDTLSDHKKSSPGRAAHFRITRDAPRGVIIAYESPKVAANHGRDED